jgi:Glycosyl transferases group 1
MIEAMACGTPVIAWPRGSVPEVIEDGATGFVVESEAEAVAAIGRIRGLDRRRIRERFDLRSALHGAPNGGRVRGFLSALSLNVPIPDSYRGETHESEEAKRSRAACGRFTRNFDPMNKTILQQTCIRTQSRHASTATRGDEYSRACVKRGPSGNFQPKRFGYAHAS